MICPICRERSTSGRNRVCDSPVCREEMRRTWNETSIAIPAGYLEANLYAKKLGISRQAVTKNCRAGKYPGAFQDPQSGRWYVPQLETVEHVETAPRRKLRPLKATDDEWEKIVELAAMTKYNVNEYIIRMALGKDIALGQQKRSS